MERTKTTNFFIFFLFFLWLDTFSKLFTILQFQNQRMLNHEYKWDHCYWECWNVKKKYFNQRNAFFAQSEWKSNFILQKVSNMFLLLKILLTIVRFEYIRILGKFRRFDSPRSLCGKYEINITIAIEAIRKQQTKQKKNFYMTDYLLCSVTIFMPIFKQ